MQVCLPDAALQLSINHTGSEWFRGARSTSPGDLPWASSLKPREIHSSEPTTRICSAYARDHVYPTTPSASPRRNGGNVCPTDYQATDGNDSRTSRVTRLGLVPSAGIPWSGAATRSSVISRYPPVLPLRIIALCHCQQMNFQARSLKGPWPLAEARCSVRMTWNKTWGSGLSRGH